MNTVCRCTTLSLVALFLYACGPRTTDSGMDLVEESLTGVRWMLTSLLAGTEVPEESGRVPYLILHEEENRLEAFGGCNRMTGLYTLEAETLTFGTLASTRMFCEGRMEVEEAFADALGSSVRWRISDGSLVLLDVVDREVASFTRAEETAN